MVGAANPNRAVVLELVAAKFQPFQVEFIDALESPALVPFALVDADYFPGLVADAATGEWRRAVKSFGVAGRLAKWRFLRNSCPGHHATPILRVLECPLVGLQSVLARTKTLPD